MARGQPGAGDGEEVGLQGAGDTKRHISAGITGSTGAQILPDMFIKGLEEDEPT